jgi:hypothetical protein
MADKYPEGKMTQSDKGELQFKVVAYEGRVIMDWGRPVQWVGFRPFEARTVADALIRYAAEAENQVKDLK